MANHDAPVASATTGFSEPAGSYCCECGTFDAHTTRCLCCGFDFRSEAEVAESVAE